MSLALLAGVVPLERANGQLSCASCVAVDRCTGTVFNADGCCWGAEPVCVIFRRGRCITDVLIGCTPADS